MAMTELGSYYISLVPTAHNITGNIARELSPVQGIATRVGDDSGRGFSGAFGKAVHGMGDALAATLKVGAGAAMAGIAAAGAVGIKTAAQLETANIAFSTMLGSADKAKSFLGDLKTFAAKTPFDLPGLQESASSLISIGVDSKKIIPIMTTLGNVTSGMGTGAEGIKRATVALQQMNASGKISAEDLNQLRDAGIPVFELLTAATGKTTAEIADMRDKGKLGREELEALMSALETGKGFERFNGLMDAQSQSLTGLWSTLKDTFSVGMAEAIEPALPIIKAGLGGTISWLSDTAVPKLQAALKDGVGGLNSFVNAWKYNDGDITSDGWHGQVEAFAYWLHQLWDRIQTIDFSSVQGFFGSLGNLGPSFSSIATSAQTLAPAVGEFVRSVVSAAPAGMAVGFDLLAGVLGFLSDHVDWIVAHMPLLVAGFVAWRVAQMGVNIMTAASIPLMIAANTARTAAAIAEYRLAVAQRANTAAGVANIGVQQTSTLASARHAVAAGAHAAATTAQTTATRIATGAQWLWNTAMSAFPLILIIAGIAALVAGIVWFATQTDAGRAVVATAWAGIQGAVAGLVNFWNGVLVPAAQWVFGVIGQGAMWLWNNVMVPAWTGIQNAAGTVFSWFTSWAVPLFQGAMTGIGIVATWLWQNVLVPAWAGIQIAVQVAWMMIKGYFDAWVWVYQNVLAPVITWLWESVLQPAFFLMGEAIRVFWEIGSFIFRAFWAILTNVVGPVIAWLWQNVAVPAFEGIAGVVAFMWNVVVKPIFDIIMFVIRGVLAAAFMFLWQGIVKPVFEGIAAVVSWAWINVISPIWNTIVAFLRDTLGPPFNVLQSVVARAWDGISSKIRDTWSWIRDNVLNPLITFVTVNVPNAFGDAARWIGDKWQTLKDLTKAPIVWVIDEVVNKGVIGTFNKVAGFLGIKGIDPVQKPPGWATGGYTGPGGKFDPAGIVHADEYVLRSEAQRSLAKQYGLSALDYMNRYGALAPNMVPRADQVQATGPGTGVYGSLRSFGNPLQAEVERARVLNVAGGASPYNIRRAASLWSGLAGVEVGMGVGGPNAPTVRVSRGPQIRMSGGGLSAGYYQGRDIVLGDSGGGAEANMVVAVHEIGHALGLPHAHEGNGAYSVMNYNSQWKTKGNPTSADVGALRAIYPGAARGVNGGGGDGGGGGTNPFESLLNSLGDMVKTAFPAGGKFVDLAVGTLRKIVDEMGKWLLDKLGGFWDMFDGGDKENAGNNSSVADIAKSALKRENAWSEANQSALVHRIMQESGGDKNAVNNWDSNARAGTPTKGLMQLLDSNFAYYRDRHLSADIFNPLANVIAGVRYTEGRYPSRKMADVWRQAGGYWDGGLVEFDNGGYLEQGMPAIHRKKKPDAVLTPHEWDTMYDIADSARQPAAVYVENPFTGDYLLAETQDYAVDATGDVMASSLRRTRRGGKYAGVRSGRR